MHVLKLEHSVFETEVFLSSRLILVGHRSPEMCSQIHLKPYITPNRRNNFSNFSKFGEHQTQKKTMNDAL
jgi:hypothetical protein